MITNLSSPSNAEAGVNVRLTLMLLATGGSKSVTPDVGAISVTFTLSSSFASDTATLMIFFIPTVITKSTDADGLVKAGKDGLKKEER